MHTHIKNRFLFYTFTLFVYLNSLFLMNTEAQVGDGPAIGSASENYTFETIDVPGVDFLSLTASSDFEDYAGYTKNTDGEKMVAFTLIDGVFKTYDFPGSQNTYFYALGNNGDAAGYYEDSEGHRRGILLQDGELRPYDFPGSVETEIYGISDATRNLTGNWTDASGIRRGFTGDIIVEYPGASETYADFINAEGGMVGSYVGDDGTYTPYLRAADGRFVSFDLPTEETYEFFYVHGQTDTKISVARGAAYWDGRNVLGERIASGVYFYQLTMPSFQQTRRLVILK